MLIHSRLVLPLDMSAKYIYKIDFDLDNVSEGSYSSQTLWPGYLTKLESLAVFQQFPFVISAKTSK